MQSDVKKRLWTVKGGYESPYFWEVDKNAWKALPTIYSRSAFTPVYIGYPTKKGIKKFVVSNCI